MLVSELYTGATILLEEADGSYGSYILVQFDYNDGIALLWRYNSIGNTQWQTATTSAAETIYQGSNLDNYITTWYFSLPSSTRQLLTQVSYPVTSVNSTGRTQTYISRYAATVSYAELGGTTANNDGYHGTELETYYLQPGDDVSYWTRQSYKGLTRVFYYSITDQAFMGDVSTGSHGVRPTVGVYQDEIEATWDGELGGYKLSYEQTQCIAPDIMKLNGYETNYSDQEPSTKFVLYWNEGTAGINAAICGHAVYYSTSLNSGYTQYGDIVYDGTSMEVEAPSSYSTTWYFRVKTLGPTSSLDSELSTVYRSISTKADPNATQCTAPAALYLNGGPYNYVRVELGDSYNLSWDAGTGSSITGYAVWRKTSSMSDYAIYRIVTGTSATVYASSQYGTITSFKVQTLSSNGSSGKSDDSRSITTKHPISYYNGTSWIAPWLSYYNGSSWTSFKDIIHYPSYKVTELDNVQYGFRINSSGYFESENAGVNSSYALCKVRIFSDGVSHMYVDYINHGENGWDYGLISKLDTILSEADLNDSTNIHSSFETASSDTVKTLDYGVLSAGEHFIYAKYIKDSSGSTGNDSLQFKVRFV